MLQFRPSRMFAYRFSLIGLLSTIAIVALATTLRPGLAAQADHSLSYDQPATGTISDTNSEDRWTFNAPGQDAVSITVTRDEKDQPAGALNTIVPEITLQDATGKIIAQAAHDPQTYDNAVIQSTILPAPGTYTIVVDRYQGQTGKTQGMYSVQVHLIGAGPDRLNVIPELIMTPTFVPTGAAGIYGPIIADNNIYELGVAPFPSIGTIRGDAWASLFFLSADTLTKQRNTFVIPAPFRLHVVAYRINGDLLPTLSLIPLNIDALASGTPITYNSFHSPQLKDLPTPIAFATAGPPPAFPVEIMNMDIATNRENFKMTTSVVTDLNTVVTQSGEYAIVVSRQDGQQGTTTGQFAVGLVEPYKVPCTFDLRHIGLVGSPTSVGDIQNGRFDGPGGCGPYSLYLTTPQTISISVQRTSGNLLPIVWIEDANGTKLASANTDTATFSSATISKVQLPAAGIYLIVVAGQGENLGVTSGNFTIKVSAAAP